jgi:hypothetical protein
MQIIPEETKVVKLKSVAVEKSKVRVINATEEKIEVRLPQGRDDFQL